MRSYTRDDIRKAFREVGLEKGDTVFIHSNLGFFGRLEKARTSDEYADAFLSELQSIIGFDGNVCVPSFTYSFCNGETFDPLSTPTNMGAFAEYVRTSPGAIRSADANFSVSVLGRDAVALTSNVPVHSFGPDSFWERFLKKDGKILNMNFDAGSTFVHFVEKSLDVPYRYDKTFSGKSLINGIWKDTAFTHFVRHLDKPEWDTSFRLFDKLAKERGITNNAVLCRGSVVAMKSADVFRIIERELKRDPYYITVSKET